MELILFIGIQASGKSSYFKEHFFNSHIRLNLDMLKTRHREKVLLEACIEGKQSLVVDNTNPTVEVRRRYIERAKAAGIPVIGYYFRSSIKECLTRNKTRQAAARIPDKGVKATHSKLELPTMDEGFDALYYVHIDEQGRFHTEPFANTSAEQCS